MNGASSGHETISTPAELSSGGGGRGGCQEGAVTLPIHRYIIIRLHVNRNKLQTPSILGVLPPSVLTVGDLW